MVSHEHLFQAIIAFQVISKENRGIDSRKKEVLIISSHLSVLPRAFLKTVSFSSFSFFHRNHCDLSADATYRKRPDKNRAAGASDYELFPIFGNYNLIPLKFWY